MKNSIMTCRLSMGQATVACRICNSKNNLRWFCVDCELDSSFDNYTLSRKFLLCEECKNRHHLIPATSNHNILSFNDIDRRAHDELIKGKIIRTNCRKHPDETYQLFCETCQFLVCTSCVSKYHLGHIAAGIDYFITETLRKSDKKLMNRIPARFLARSPSEDREFRTQNGGTINEMLPVEISQIEDELEVASYPLNEQFNVIKTAVANVPCIYFLKTVSSNTAWIGCTEMDRILQVRISYGHKFLQKNLECKETDEVLGVNTRDIGILMDKKLLLVTKDNFYIKMVSKNLNGGIQVNEFCSFKPLLPISVCVEKGGEQRIWVGLKEYGEDFTPNLNSVRRLVEISISGRINKTIEKTKAHKPLFTIPWRIIHFDDRLCVLDKTQTKTGRVIALKTTGHLMWCYNPEICTPDERQFYPTGLAASSLGKILIIDGANSSLHILNIHGELVLKQPMRDVGIRRPFSVDTDEDDQIWIGSAGSEGKSSLHIVKFLSI